MYVAEPHWLCFSQLSLRLTVLPVSFLHGWPLVHSEGMHPNWMSFLSPFPLVFIQNENWKNASCWCRWLMVMKPPSGRKNPWFPSGVDLLLHGSQVLFSALVPVKPPYTLFSTPLPTLVIYLFLIITISLWFWSAFPWWLVMLSTFHIPLAFCIFSFEKCLLKFLPYF